MGTALTVSLITLSIMGLITQVAICLVLLRLIREMERWQHLPIVLPERLPIIATLPAVGLTGGAVRFELDNGGRAVLDMGDGAGPFANEVGEEMLVTFQRIER